MKAYFNGLVEIEENEDIQKVMENISYENAFDLLYAILSQAVIAGGYNLEEGYIIHECFYKIKPEKINRNEDK